MKAFYDTLRSMYKNRLKNSKNGDGMVKCIYCPKYDFAENMINPFWYKGYHKVCPECYTRIYARHCGIRKGSFA